MASAGIPLAVPEIRGLPDQIQRVGRSIDSATMPLCAPGHGGVFFFEMPEISGALSGRGLDKMERTDLDLRFSVFEGTTPSIGTLLLYTHLRTQPRRSHSSPPEYLVLYREKSACAPAWITTSVVTDEDILRLEKLLDAAGFPMRIPRVAPNESLLGQERYVVLEARIREQSASLVLTLESAGFSGEDAEPLRAAASTRGDGSARPPTGGSECGGPPGLRSETPGLPGTIPRWPHLSWTRLEEKVRRQGRRRPRVLGRCPGW